MRETDRGVSDFEDIDAILANPELYALGELIPEVDPTAGGRPRHYPGFMLILFNVLISVYGSARKVEAQLAYPKLWEHIRSVVAQHRPDITLPEQPMRRHHYLYGRNRYLQDPSMLERAGALHRRFAAGQAREIGLLHPDGLGSFTHPELTRLLYGDGKVITPLYRAQPGTTKTDARTGEVRELRAEPDAGPHYTGSGDTAWGTKFVLIATRDEHRHSRILLDVAFVPKPGQEASTAVECITRLAPEVPGAQGVVYDTALRGAHHQRLLRDLGLMPINRVAAAKAGATKPRRGKRRVEKTVRVEDKTITLPDGTTTTVALYAQGGAIGIGQLTDTGDLEFVELRRVRTHRIQDRNGKYRWYNDYALPPEHGDATITVRLHGSAEDEARGFNRTENVRPIPPTDPDFGRLFSRRSDAESINRALDDTFYLRRAHSVGHDRQLVDLLGFALMMNSRALHQHRRRRAATALAAAA